MAVGGNPGGRREPGWLATGRARVRLLLEGTAADDQTWLLAFPVKSLTAPPEEIPFLRFAETLPLPVAAIPPQQEAGVASFPLWEHLLGELAMLTDPDRPEAPTRLPFCSADLRNLACRWRDLGEPELADHLVRAAERQEAWRQGTEAPLPEAVAALPPLAFPTVVHRADHSLVVWESVLTTPPPVGWVPDEEGQDPTFLQAIHRAQVSIQKWFGAEAATRFLCPATHLFGLPIAGGSGGLAMWIALYLALSGGRLPVPALAVTGELGEGGAVLGVGEIERKVEAALGCGYPRIIVPAADLDVAPAWMRQDPRILGVRTCHDVREWLLANDPRFAARCRCFHLARGCLAAAPAVADDSSGPMAALVREDLLQDRWATTWRTLRRVVRESSRPGRARRWSALVGQWQAALAALLGENRHRKIDRRVWVGLFRQLVPESVFLLHLPLLLERYGQSERALADQLYAHLGHRLADQDLDLDLALRWGQPLFDDPVASPWYQPAFRRHYPLLDWFLFADPLVALDRLLAWPEPTADERQWRHALFQALARLPPKALAGVGKRVRAHWRDLLRTAAKATLPDFQPALANMTLIDHRPALLLKIWLQHRGQLSHPEADILRAHVGAHLAFRQTSDQLCRALEKVWASRVDLAELLVELDQAGARSSSPMVRRCRDLMARLASLDRPERRAPSSWPEHLRAAWRGEGKGSSADRSAGQSRPSVSDHGASTTPGGSGRRSCVQALDRHLTEALLGLITGKVVEGAGLAFQMLTNPAMVLARLALAGQDRAEQATGRPDATRAVCRQLGEALSTGVGFRSDLGRECLWHWAGRLFGGQGLPPPGGRKVPLAYWTGFWAVSPPETRARLEREEIWPRLIELCQKPHLPAMLWLPYLPSRVPAAVRGAVAEAVTGLVQNISVGREEERAGRELAPWLLWSARPRWSIWRRLGAAKAARRRGGQAREAALARAPLGARVADQGLLPLARLWRGWPRVPWRLAARLARTRGFSPLALAFPLLFPPGRSPGNGRNAPAPGLERLLAAGRLWPLEWERHQACTIALMTLWQAGEVGRLRRLFLSETLDPLNLWLCRDLLRDVDQSMSESRATLRRSPRLDHRPNLG